MMTHLTAALNPASLQNLLEQAAQALELSNERVFELANTIKQQAEATNDEAALFQGLLLLGKHHLEKQCYSDAIALLESLLAMQLRLEPLIRACAASEEINRVLTYAPEALRYFALQQDLAQQAHLHEILGHTYTYLYAFQESLEHHFKALTLYQTLGQPGDAYISIGWTYFSMRDYQKAKEFFLLVREIANTSNDLNLGARAIGNLANVYGSLEDYQTSTKYHHQAIEISRSLGKLGYIAVGYGNIGTDYCQQGMFEEGIVYFRRPFSSHSLTAKRLPY
jgi:tetratricopeptide (TPR) repeat protein